MKYCILVELSRKSIKFSHYTSESGKFQPYGAELVRPLAVWFNGSSVIIGSDARNEAVKRTPNAFYDLFDLMKQQDFFNYAHEKHEFNKLILYTIRAGLKEFFINQMLNTLGTLDANISSLPLLIEISPDVEPNERIVLLHQLRSNGFGNVHEINEDSYALKAFELDNQLSLVLSCLDSDIYGTIYYAGETKSRFILKNAGKDPRIEKLERMIWERSGAENAWLNFEDEEEVLRNAAVRFIQSGELEVNDNIVLSDGYTYDYYLTNNDLNLYNQIDGTYLVREIMDKVDVCGEHKNCHLILKDEAVTNKYLQGLLQPEFNNIKILDSFNKDYILDKILTWAIENNLDFSKYNSKKDFATPVQPSSQTCENKSNTTSNNIATPQLTKEVGWGESSSQEQPFNPNCWGNTNSQVSTQGGWDISQNKTQESPQPTVAKATKRDEHDFKILEATVATYIKNGNTQRAIAEVKAFEQKMVDRNVSDFKERIAALLEDTKKNAQVENKVESAPTNMEVHATKRDEHDFKILEATVETLLINQNHTDAKAKIMEFQQKMYERNIHDFDERIKKLLGNIKEGNAPTNTQKTESTSSVPVEKPTKRDERELKILEMSVETHLRNQDIETAQLEIEKFATDIHRRNIHDFDKAMDELLNKLKNNTQMTMNQKADIAAKATKRDERDFKILDLTVETCLKNKDLTKAITEINKFSAAIHSRNIHEFDKACDALLAKCK